MFNVFEKEGIEMKNYTKRMAQKFVDIVCSQTAVSPVSVSCRSSVVCLQTLLTVVFVSIWRL